MSNYVINYPFFGIATYSTITAFPAHSANGTVAIALDTYDMYVYETGSSSWVLIAGPPGGATTTYTNVKAYGAIGNGIADDTASILAAIAHVQSLGGGTVFFPSGQYLITSELSVPDYVNLMGEGAGGPRGNFVATNTGASIIVAGANNMNMIHHVGSMGGAQNLCLSNWGAFTGVSGLRVTPVSETQTTTVVNQNFNYFANLYIWQCTEGVVLQCGPIVATVASGCWYNNFEAITINSCTRGIWLKDAPNAGGSPIDRNKFSQIRVGQSGCNTGLQIDSGSQCFFSGVDFEGVDTGITPNATPTAILIKLAGTTSGSACESNRFVSCNVEGCTRDLDNSNTLSEFIGCFFTAAKLHLTATPLWMSGGYNAGTVPQIMPGYTYQTAGQIAGIPDNTLYAAIPITSTGLITGNTLTVTSTSTFSALTASLPVFTNASKQLVSNAITGSGSVVMDGSPTITSPNFSGTVNINGLTASQAIFTDVSKNLVSNAITGSGNVVMSTSPTLTSPALGTPTALVGTNITGTAAGLTAGNVTTNANLTGVITSVGNATSIASQTGTGTTFVMSAGPTLTGVTTVANLLDSGLSVSQAVVTDGSENLVSLAYTNANTASTIVSRDGSGNFSAGTITAALTGTASGNTTYSASNHGLVISSATNAMTVKAPDASTTKLLQSAGSSADPAWVTLSGDVTIASGGATTVAAIAGTTVSGTTGTGSVVFGGTIQTWTPAYSASGSSGITYSSQVGRYFRFGNLVYFFFDIVLSGGTLGTTSAVVSLPIAVSNITGLQPIFQVLIANATGLATGNTPLGIASPGSSSVNLLYTNTGGNMGTSNLSGANLTNSSEIICTGFYPV